ncbi:MAG: protein-L-isoaspartate(D-aspartate) O-methyltransferase [Euryarchaeota archaeon]|nr:protein-L-isoaspartate(D-aspartate) O-methyltransferase [Euryarchaeota archaeon]
MEILEDRERRKALVESLRSRGHLRSEAVADAMLRVERHRFLPPSLASQAYDDKPLEIGEGQTISAPHMVVIMAEAAKVAPGQRLLEIGGGSGYMAAILSDLAYPAGKVYTVEKSEPLARTLLDTVTRLGLRPGVEVYMGDGSQGISEKAPFDRIIVSCAAAKIPPELENQLAPGGILLVPLGGHGGQKLIRITFANGKRKTEDLGGCMFVPMVWGGRAPMRMG